MLFIVKSVCGGGELTRRRALRKLGKGGAATRFAPRRGARQRTRRRARPRLKGREGFSLARDVGTCGRALGKVGAGCPGYAMRAFVLVVVSSLEEEEEE